MADKIQKAYQASKKIYDDVLTQGSIFSKLYIKFFWSGTDDNEIARKLLSYIPDDYSGTILDVQLFLLLRNGQHLQEPKLLVLIIVRI